MDFQLVEGALETYGGSRFMVVGSSLVLPADSALELQKNIQQLAETGATRLDELEAAHVDFQERPKLVASHLDLEVNGTSLGPPLMDTSLVVATRKKAKPMAYFRFSANPNDPRVLRSGDFVKGTYATTYNDLQMVPSGFAAVGRYALPSSLSAKFMYIIITDSVPQLIGTAVPNFGQAGGGVEVQFVNGAKALYGIPHEIATE
jgi:hypothetical protein